MFAKKGVDTDLIDRLDEGIESGELVIESVYEENAIKELERRQTKRKKTREVVEAFTGSIKEGGVKDQVEDNDEGVLETSSLKKILAVVVLIAIAIAMTVFNPFSSGEGSDVGASASPEVSLQTTPAPNVNATPAPTPGPAPGPAPSPKSSSFPSGNGGPPRSGTTNPPPSIAPAPIVPNATGQNVGTIGSSTPPPAPKVFDQSDSTPNGDSQRSDKISDREHGGESVSDGSKSNDGAGNLDPADGSAGTIQ